MNTEHNQLLSFIAKDLAAGKNLGPLRWSVLALVFFIPLIFNLTFGFNPDLNWRDSWMPWAMLALFFGLAFVFSRTLERATNIFVFSLISIAVLFATFAFPQFGSGFSMMSGYVGYWADTLKCFIFGMMVGGLTALTLAFFVFRWGSVPSAGSRLAMSQIAGLAGAFGLFFKCPNSDFIHLLTGHGSQMAAVFFGTYLLSKMLFIRIVRKQLGKAAAQFEHIEKFDKS
jgi:hypothetical protein